MSKWQSLRKRIGYTCKFMFYLYDIGTGNVFVKILRKVEEIILSYVLLSTAVIYNKGHCHIVCP